MDTRTLEQVIMDASRGFYEPRARSHMVTAEAEVIADAVRAWMRERECIMPGSLCKKTHDNARIKELEAEVDQLKSSASLEKMQRDASAYRDLRERFPFLPGEEFYATVSSKRLILNVGDPIPELIIYKRTVNLVGVNGVLDTKDNTWNWDECHPTADACRAAIPVEEGEKIETKSNA